MRVRDDRDSRLGVATKVAYGVGALTDSIKTFAFTTFLLFYYTTVLGLPGAWLGLAMSVGLVWDAAIDPLIGHTSDRAMTRLGRRQAFMLVGAIGAGASLVAVFNPPPGLSPASLFAWLMASSLCTRSSTSLFMVPYYALGAELPGDEHERTSISGYRAAAALAGTLLATAAAFLVFLRDDAAPGTGSRFARGSYESMGVAFGVAIALAGLASAVGTIRERRGRSSPTTTRSGVAGFRHTLGDTLRHRAFRIVVLSQCLVVMGTAINGALGMHFLTYHARLAGGHGMIWYFAAYCAGALVGVLAWVRVTTRVEKHHAYAAAMFMSAFVMSWGYYLVGEGRPFAEYALSVVVIGAGLVGFFGSAAAVIVPSIVADLTARDERHAGRRRDGVFFGVYSFGLQLSGGLALLVAGILVDRFAGLVPGQIEQSAATIERLAILSNLVPALLIAGAGLIALRCRVTRVEASFAQPDLAAPADRPQLPA